MVKFLVTVILAIFIFIPACAFVTKFFFRISAQGEDSFRDLVDEVREVAEQADGEQRTFVLKMDAKTLITASEAGTGTILLFSFLRGTDLTQSLLEPTSYYIETEGHTIPMPLPAPLIMSTLFSDTSFLEVAHVNVGYYFSPRHPTCSSASCLCLCTEIVVDQVNVTSQENPLTGDVYLRCESEDLSCSELSSADFQSSWSLIRFSEQDPRRIPLRIKKEAGKVVIEELS